MFIVYFNGVDVNSGNASKLKIFIVLLGRGDVKNRYQRRRNPSAGGTRTHRAVEIFPGMIFKLLIIITR